ncbi:MAG: glycoside hydrolase family 32 protein [Acidobacteria bacterium]|nr:MAG: glycoside hydrolase family 32 protein [Acidobacteriota bacterium]
MRRPRGRLILPIASLCGFLLVSSAWQTQDYSQPHRPQFHFSPPVNWINDPNGMVYYQGEFHLFYQYNPFGNGWGHMSWGHAISRDLVHWENLPVALRDEDGIMIFSGSAVADTDNSSELGTKSAPPLVAVYTGHTADRQTQNLAFSTDRGRTWRKYSGNPVLDRQQKDFRDPKVFWHEPTRRWIMVVALPVARKVAFYSSSNLIDWAQTGDYGPAGATEGIWECPDLFELPVEGTAADKKWVLIVNVNPGAVAGGSGTQYFVGAFDDKTFRADSSPSPRWADYGSDFYAGVSWSSMPSGDPRRVWLAWMSNWRYADKVPTSPWKGAMTLPRALALRNTEAGLSLFQTPIAELRILRGELLQAGDITITAANRLLEQARMNGDLLEIEAEFDIDSAQDFGINVRVGENQKTRVGYNVARKAVYVDRRSSGRLAFDRSFPAVHSAPMAAPKSRVKLHIFVDRSSVELFANHGERVITDLIFPDRTSAGLNLYEEGGRAHVRYLRVWKLNPIWKQ